MAATSLQQKAENDGGGSAISQLVGFTARVHRVGNSWSERGFRDWRESLARERDLGDWWIRKRYSLAILPIETVRHSLPLPLPRRWRPPCPVRHTQPAR